MGDTETIVQGVIAQDGQRLDKALADASGLSRERIKALLGEGRITLGGKAVAKFRQDYRADALTVSSRKTLELHKVGDRWLIVNHNSSPMPPHWKSQSRR